MTTDAHRGTAQELVLRPLTGHDRRRLRTRARLLDAARALISEDGIDNLQFSGVAKRAQVGVGTVYNHFQEKDGLIDAVVHDMLIELTQATASGGGETSLDPSATGCNALRRFVRLAYDEPQLAKLIVNVSQTDALMAGAVYPTAAQVLRAGVASGDFQTSDVEVTVITTIGGAMALMRAILAGAVGEGAEISFAEQTLRGLGVSADECRKLVGQKLPPLQPASATAEPRTRSSEPTA